jgi:hypothetical protein
MYEYAFCRIPSPPTLNTIGNIEGRVEAYLDYCRQAIVNYSRDGWRFVKVIKPIEGTMMSEIVFERPIQDKAPSQ